VAGPYWSVQAEAGGLEARDDGGEALIDVFAEVPVSGVVDGVDPALRVYGEQGLAVAFFAEGGDIGFQGAAEVGEGAGEVQSGEWVEADRSGGVLPAGWWAGDAEATEFCPGFDGGGEDAVAVACG
jgi:hypothetical protein